MLSPSGVPQGWHPPQHELVGVSSLPSSVRAKLWCGGSSWTLQQKEEALAGGLVGESWGSGVAVGGCRTAATFLGGPGLGLREGL